MGFPLFRFGVGDAVDDLNPRLNYGKHGIFLIMG